VGRAGDNRRRLRRKICLMHLTHGPEKTQEGGLRPPSRDGEEQRNGRSGYTWVVKTDSKKSTIAPVAGAGKILALDYGRTRIGVAIADAVARIAEPLTTLERINRNEDMRRLRELARDAGVKRIVVGLPLKLDGSHGEMAEEATGFAERVRKQLGLPVEMVDERLTSWEAERILEEELGRRITHQETPGGRKRLSRPEDGKYSVDAVAAMVILREYLTRESGAEEQR
jgi:putative Holliday junction resolvase